MANDQNIGSLMSAGYLSYLNDDPGKEWERDLLTAPAGANLYGREQARETLALLWNTGDLTAVSGLTTLSGLTSVSGLASVSGLTAAPEQTAASTLSAVAAGSGDSEDSGGHRRAVRDAGYRFLPQHAAGLVPHLAARETCVLCSRERTDR